MSPKRWVMQAPGRSALFIDLDNVTISKGQSLAAEQAEQVLLRIVMAAGPVDWQLAVAPRGTITRYGATLAKLGMQWDVVPCGPDAADARILEAAFDLSGHGFTHYTVASADGYFAQISRLGSLKVITRVGQQVSWRLRATASELVPV